MQLSLFKFFLDRRPIIKRKRPLNPPAPRPRPLRQSPEDEGEISERELKALWVGLRRHFFPDKPDLDNYQVYWSSRPQKRTLASCNIERRAVRVARELNYSHLKYWLSPLLYHEMCHAYLGFSVYSEEGRSRWHGPEFKRLERRHAGVARLDAWIKEGGWEKAVRSDRAKRAYRKRTKRAS